MLKEITRDQDHELEDAVMEALSKRQVGHHVVFPGDYNAGVQIGLVSGGTNNWGSPGNALGKAKSHFPS
ncbi:hypothetical protein N7501_009405 [Penicillium viridicatum]|nr:hypothetical protein N7501_009405 [Penicillium viridicatum]